MSEQPLRVGYLPGLSEHEVSWETMSLGSEAQPLRVEMPRLTSRTMGCVDHSRASRGT